MDSRDLNKEATQLRRIELKREKGDHREPRRPCRKNEKVIKGRDNKHERNMWKGRTKKKQIIFRESKSFVP